MNAHARLAPSTSSRWINCPGSTNLIASLTQKSKSSFYQNEGSVAHLFAEWALASYVTYIHESEDAALSNLVKFLEESINKDAGTYFLNPEYNGIIIGQEMINYVREYIDYVVDLIPHYSDGNDVCEFECKLPLFYEQENYGTADAIIINDGHIHVIDLKYGKGVKVEIWNNTQLIIYAICALDYYGPFYEINHITTHIVQPRLQNMQSQTFHVDELLEWKKTIDQAAKATNDEAAPCIAGESQCRWCEAKAVCRALADYNFKLSAIDFQNIEEDKLSEPVSPLLLTNEQLKTILDHSDVMRDWLNSVVAYVQAMIESGQAFPGYKVVEGRSIRRWVNETRAITFLTETLNLHPEDIYTIKLVSPAKAEKLVNKTNRSQLSDFIEKPVGSPVLAPESDKRSPIITNIAKEFEDLSNE